MERRISRRKSILSSNHISINSLKDATNVLTNTNSNSSTNDILNAIHFISIYVNNNHVLSKYALSALIENGI